MHLCRYTGAGRLGFTFVAAASLGLFAQQAAAQADSTKLTREQKEDFLLHAKVVKTAASKKGVTDTIRATLSDGKITHDASIQRIDDTKRYDFGDPFLQVERQDDVVADLRVAFAEEGAEAPGAAVLGGQRADLNRLFAEDVIALLDALKVERANVLGFSMESTTTQALP